MMSQSSGMAPLQREPEEAQEGKNTCHPAAIKLQPQPTVSPKGAQGVKTQDTPHTAEVHFKGMLSVSPDSAIFPYIEKP